MMKLRSGSHREWLPIAPLRQCSRLYIASLKAVGRRAVKPRHVTRNPFEGCSIVVPRKLQNRETRTFTNAEVQTVLSAASLIIPQNPAHAGRRWVPWLCAYTGAGAGEITQLRGKDVSEKYGIKAIRMTPEAGTVKTKQARVVPVHEHLIEQGLWEFVKQQGGGPLFYRARSADTGGSADPTKPQHARCVHVRSKLAQWIRSIGISDPKVSPTHGWRHTFKQIADRYGSNERVSDKITGSAPQTEGRKFGEPTLQDMAGAMKKFSEVRGRLISNQ